MSTQTSRSRQRKLHVNGTSYTSGQNIQAGAFRFDSGSGDGTKTYGDFRTNLATGNTIISAPSGALYFNFDNGTGGVIFGNGAAGIVGSVSAAGNAQFLGSGNHYFAGNLGIGTTG